MRRREPIDQVGPATNYPARSGGWAPRSTGDELLDLVMDYGGHVENAAIAATRGDEAAAAEEGQAAILTFRRIMVLRGVT